MGTKGHRQKCKHRPVAVMNKQPWWTTRGTSTLISPGGGKQTLNGYWRWSRGGCVPHPPPPHCHLGWSRKTPWWGGGAVCCRAAPQPAARRRRRISQSIHSHGRNVLRIMCLILFTTAKCPQPIIYSILKVVVYFFHVVTSPLPEHPW